MVAIGVSSRAIGVSSRIVAFEGNEPRWVCKPWSVPDPCRSLRVTEILDLQFQIPGRALPDDAVSWTMAQQDPGQG